MSTAIQDITDYFKQSREIDISPYDESFLDKSLQKRITETKCDSPEEYGRFLKQNHQEGERFIDSLHISYSDFFRNPLTFAVLERLLIPALILNKKNTKYKEIRIWSAACAAGQEAYSLAMLLEEHKEGETNKFDYRIFATDVSEIQIHQARKGQYSEANLSNLNLKRIHQWFIKQGDIYTVTPKLKGSIDFSVFDLCNEKLSSPPTSIFGDFDIVFCANLLFYFKNEYREIILEKTGNCLASGGYLITGETEREIVLKHNYQEIIPQSAIFRRLD